MNARQILEAGADKQGWNEESQIIILCRFIDFEGLELIDAFKDFVEAQVDEEGQLIEDSDVPEDGR